MQGILCFKWVGLDDKNSVKHHENSLNQLKTASTNSPWAYIWEGLLLKGYLCLRFGGLIFGRAYFFFFFFGGGGGLIIGILRYLIKNKFKTNEAVGL